MRGHVIEQNQQEDQIIKMRIDLIRKRAKNGLITVALFIALIIAIVGYRYYATEDLVEEGMFYRKIRNYQILRRKGQVHSNKGKREGVLAVKNKELGKMSWTVLHMASGSFPKQYDKDLGQKFITFLQLFGQLYPCKQCGLLFLQKMKELQQFQGTTKKQIMVYLCKLHNKINDHIGEPNHSCSKVDEQWNSCGCAE